jgi:hypothetical protein
MKTKYLKTNNRRGFITYLVVIIAAIILIAYFRTDIQKIFDSPGIKNALLTAISWIQQALLWIVAKLGWTSNQIK